MSLALVALLAFLALLFAHAIWQRRRRTRWLEGHPVLRGAVGGAQLAVMLFLLFAATGDDRSARGLGIGTALFVGVYAALAWAEEEPERDDD